MFPQVVPLFEEILKKPRIAIVASGVPARGFSLGLSSQAVYSNGSIGNLKSAPRVWSCCRQVALRGKGSLPGGSSWCVLKGSHSEPVVSPARVINDPSAAKLSQQKTQQKTRSLGCCHPRLPACTLPQVLAKLLTSCRSVPSLGKRRAIPPPQHWA